MITSIFRDKILTLKNLKKFFLFILLIPFLIQVQGQTVKGFLKDNDTGKGIGFVNIGIIGKNKGTVSNENGTFNLHLTNNEIYDSIRFSIVGFNSRIISVRSLLNNSIDTITLEQTNFKVPEVIIKYKKIKNILLGTSIPESKIGNGFFWNDLGCELGTLVDPKYKVRVNDINLNIALCTYDSVIYRLNIYSYDDNQNFKNILSEPIYLAFTNKNIKTPVSIDLRKYSIVISGKTMVAIQLIKDLPDGRLLIQSDYDNSNHSFNRLSVESPWREVPGGIGIYLTGQIIE